jgi:membrane protein
MSAGGLARITGRLERTFAGRCLGTFVEIQGIDRATAMAAQAFTALIPLLLLLTAALPSGGRDVAGDAIIQRFGLTGDAAAAVRSLFARSGEPSIGILSVILLLFSALSLTRRMQNLYLQAWRLRVATGVRRSMNAALGLAALLLEITLLYIARKLIGALPISGVLSWTFAALASLFLWTSVPWLLLDRRISWRRLLPSGVLAAIGTACYGVASTVYMPALIESYSRRYGIFGVTLSLVGWLLTVALIVVAATAIGAELDRAPEPWVRRVRARFGVLSDGAGSLPDDADAPPEGATTDSPTRAHPG